MTDWFRWFLNNSKEKWNSLNANNLLEAIRFIRSFPEPTAFDFKHLVDLGMRNVWEVSWYGEDKCAVFESCNYLSVIMPKW